MTRIATISSLEASVPMVCRRVLRASVFDMELVVCAATGPTVKTSIFAFSMCTVSSIKVFNENLAVQIRAMSSWRTSASCEEWTFAMSRRSLSR